MFELVRYRAEDGREPFTDWIVSLRDTAARVQIYTRLRRFEAGNPGDVKPVGDGILELRIHVGAGYRVYFGQHGKSIVILLCGGDNSSQTKDILNAKALWTDWKWRQS